jgi:hypothetical protein
MNDDLEVLEPSGSSVTFREETIELKPLTIGQLPKLVRAARPVIDAVLSLDKVPESGDTDLVGLVMDLIEHHGEQVFEAASICTGKPANWIEGGAIDEFADLAVKVFEVNRDFFVRKLAPRLAELRAKAAGATGNAGANGAGTTA